MSPDRRDDESLLEKLSDRLVTIFAVVFLTFGAGGVALATYVLKHHPYGHDIVSALSEALMVTGATTFIVSYALSDSVRLTPIIKRAFTNYASQIPTADEISASVAEGLTASVSDAVTRLDAAIKCVATDMEKHATAMVLKQDEIYPRSMTMLKEMAEGDVRILMTAEEDLTSNPEANGYSGEDWVLDLKQWLDADYDKRKLYRVIARRPHSLDDLEQTKARLLEPFIGTNADQWVYTDAEFAVSVMLLGKYRAIFGFLPRTRRRTVTPSRTRFDYAVVVTSEMLVGNLVTWFNERYTRDNVAQKIMAGGDIDDHMLTTLTGESAADEGGTDEGWKV